MTKDLGAGEHAMRFVDLAAVVLSSALLGASVLMGSHYMKSLHALFWCRWRCCWTGRSMLKP